MKLILIHQINKFYHIFWEALDYNFQVHISNFDDDFLTQVLFDINEALKAYEPEFCEEAYAMNKWLNKLKVKILNYREKTTQKIAYKVWCVLTAVVVVWITYSCAEVVLKSMSDINLFTILSKMI